MHISFKLQAKILSKIMGIELSKAQQILAKSYQFTNLHDLQRNIERDPQGKRLRGALSYPMTPEDWSDTLTQQANQLAKTFHLDLNNSLCLANAIHGLVDNPGVQNKTNQDVVDDNIDALNDWLKEGFSDEIGMTRAYTAKDLRAFEYEILSADEVTIVISGDYLEKKDPQRPFSRDCIYFQCTCLYRRERHKWGLVDCKDLRDVTPDIAESLPGFYTGE